MPGHNNRGTVMKQDVMHIAVAMELSKRFCGNKYVQQ
jgi:hypothetical protein